MAHHVQFNDSGPATCLCCMCGEPTPPNPAFMCMQCLRTRVDITEPIPRLLAITMCKGCARWKVPPKAWVVAPLESRELLSICLKRIPGLNTVRLTDAVFIWTEPHSRRVNVKLTVQKEVFSGAILQQQVVVEFTVTTEQCPECAKSYTDHTWVASVQVRQKVPHKRTFLYLEQLILKNKMHANAVNIKEERNGVDFFFDSRSHAQRFVDWLLSVIPARYSTSKKLISHDIRNNTYHNKYSFSVEIAPVCKHDLVYLPAKTAASVGDFARFALVKRVASVFVLVDPFTSRTVAINPQRYWRDPFPALTSSRQLVNFVVLAIEPIVSNYTQGKTETALYEAMVVRESDFGVQEIYFNTTTDLGHIIHPGDIVQGYDLTSNQMLGDVDPNVTGVELPDVVLVKKIYQRTKPRRYKLKRMAVEHNDIEDGNAEDDAEQFMAEIEEDPELRSGIELFRLDSHQAEADELVPIEELVEDLEVGADME
ncbi:hypothetical protein P9112_006676 [Eukaryota sp. TZLM1-RC]